MIYHTHADIMSKIEFIFTIHLESKGINESVISFIYDQDESTYRGNIRWKIKVSFKYALSVLL